ncbi:uncharacterized protein [Nicotiana tomentosiformis]|uniref:uncharacterized protein n=1 Tax=Nicotiana tomentosiformis TaxID=4098 RepID=UPI00388CDE29
MEDKCIQPLPANPTLAQIKAHSDEKTKKYKAKTIIQNSVADLIFSKIIACETIKEAWKILKQKLLGEDFKDDRIVEIFFVTIPERFESEISSLEESKDLSTISVAELISALQAQEQRRAFIQDKVTEEMTTENGNQVVLMMTMISENFDYLFAPFSFRFSPKALNCLVINEAFQVAAMIEKLPLLWKDFKNSLKHKRKEMSLEDLIVRLRIEEDNKASEKKGRGNSTIMEANIVEDSPQNNRKRKKPSGPKSNSSKKRFKENCYNCGKTGHKSADCCAPRKDKRKGQANMVEKHEDIDDLCTMLSECNLVGNPKEW